MSVRGRLRLAWVLFISTVVVFCGAACTGIVALEEGHWITAAINGVLMAINIGLMSLQNDIIDDLNWMRDEVVAQPRR